ncbi:MAG TPA: response regulator [Xanthobacteraceae bacterium]|nr:response regulator [Xanthobacteraceae bacterium]
MLPSPGSRTAGTGGILIVEDDYLVALQIENALDEAGYMVADIASTAAEAIQLAQDYRPDLVLMDIGLAGPDDGVHAAIEILSRFRIRSIFVSAFADATTHARAAAAGPLAWVTKPVNNARLIAVVAAAIEHTKRRSGSD